jgi:hypothetical protein
VEYYEWRKTILFALQINQSLGDVRVIISEYLDYFNLGGFLDCLVDLFEEPFIWKFVKPGCDFFSHTAVITIGMTQVANEIIKVQKFENGPSEVPFGRIFLHIIENCSPVYFIPTIFKWLDAPENKNGSRQVGGQILSYSSVVRCLELLTTAVGTNAFCRHWIPINEAIEYEREHQRMTSKVTLISGTMSPRVKERFLQSEIWVAGRSQCPCTFGLLITSVYSDDFDGED